MSGLGKSKASVVIIRISFSLIRSGIILNCNSKIFLDYTGEVSFFSIMLYTYLV
jgi:hypothetical protein